METAAAKPAPNPAPESLKDPAYLKIRDLIYEISGIYQPEEKLYLLASRCARRMAAVNAKTPSDYVSFLTTRAGREAELRLLLNEITIRETYMFRIGSARRTAKRNPSRVDQKQDVDGLQAAPPVERGMLDRRKAVYPRHVSARRERKASNGMDFRHSRYRPQRQFAQCRQDRNLRRVRPSYHKRGLRRKYFKPHDEKKLQVSDQLKSMIRFDRVNLNDDSKMLFLKGLDLIFCCNVLIYFDLSSKRRVMQHFYSNLLSGGYLFLGHAESLYQVDDRFRLVHFPGAIGYWKAPAGV